MNHTKTRKNNIITNLLTGDVGKCLSLCAVMVLAMGIDTSFASSAALGLGNAICTIPNSVINTSIGRGLATLGILILGIMATLGRITWTQAVVVGVGISVIFGAASVAQMISINKGVAC